MTYKTFNTNEYGVNFDNMQQKKNRFLVLFFPFKFLLSSNLEGNHLKHTKTFISNENCVNLDNLQTKR